MSDREERKKKQKNLTSEDMDSKTPMDHLLDQTKEGDGDVAKALQDQMNTFGAQMEAMQRNMLTVIKTVSDLKDQVTAAPHPDAVNPSASEETMSTQAAQEVAAGVTSPRTFKLKPQEFGDKVSWPAYRAQFELIAARNGWDNSEKAAYLAGSLKGTALEVLGHLSAETRDNYTTLVNALEQRFGTANQDQLKFPCTTPFQNSRSR